MWNAGKKSPLQNFCNGFIQKSIPLKWLAVRILDVRSLELQTLPSI